MGLHNTTKQQPLQTPVEQAIIKRALSYPYPRPKESYLFFNGEAQPLHQQDFQGLHVVLAIGSNAAPTQLQRKYGDGVSIPVVTVEVHGLDVVYAAIMSSYGSIPATVLKSEDTVTSIHATLLTDEQLRRMHETEGGYYFCRLVHGNGVRVFRDGLAMENVYCYVTRVGALCNDQVFAIEEIDAWKRKYKTMSQNDVQGFVKGLVEWQEDVEDFVLRNVESKERRYKVMDMMKGTAIVEDCFQVVEDIGSVITSVK